MKTYNKSKGVQQVRMFVHKYMSIEIPKINTVTINICPQPYTSKFQMLKRDLFT